MRKIKICDALMGSGKTEGAIRYMNEHPEKKFLYITQYLPEAERIQACCPDANFVLPSEKAPGCYGSKTRHCAKLLAEGRNIASTHQLYKLYTDDMLDSARRGHYTLIIDEAVEVFEDAEVKPDDVRLLIEGGYIEKTDIGYKIVKDDYRDGCLSNVFTMLRHNQLVEVEYKNKISYYCWVMPKELLEAFDEVIVLTYMFHCQDFCYYMQINGIEYEYISVSTDGGVYRLSDKPGYIPPYTTRLKEKVHLVGTKAMNEIGNKRTALSERWIRREVKSREDVRSNLVNFFTNYCSGVEKERRMWGTYKSSVPMIKGKGYTKAWLPFNQKSSNAHRHKDHLAYCSNVFMNPDKRDWLVEHGADVNEDDWALSVITQWIWRSAIRDGKEIWLYLPSRRMRNMLVEWLDRTTKMGIAAYGNSEDNKPASSVADANELVASASSSDELVGGDAVEGAVTNEVGAVRSDATVSLDNNDGADAAPVGAQRPREEDVA